MRACCDSCACMLALYKVDTCSTQANGKIKKNTALVNKLVHQNSLLRCNPDYRYIMPFPGNVAIWNLFYSTISVTYELTISIYRSLFSRRCSLMRNRKYDVEMLTLLRRRLSSWWMINDNENGQNKRWECSLIVADDFTTTGWSVFFAPEFTFTCNRFWVEMVY